MRSPLFPSLRCCLCALVCVLLVVPLPWLVSAQYTDATHPINWGKMREKVHPEGRRSVSDEIRAQAAKVERMHVVFMNHLDVGQ
jgi:hypothetical protein